MIKDKLHTISDEDAEAVARLLLKSSKPYEYVFKKITRFNYDAQHGVDAEEVVNVHFDAKVINVVPYKQVGWKDVEIMVQLTEHDRYHDHPFFTAQEKEDGNSAWKHHFISNHIEAIEFLQQKGLI